MRIGGFSSLSLNDYPGHVAALVFTQGCNFRCPFCHNSSLLPMSNKNLIPEEHVLNQLSKRIKLLEGVVITGGEPTIQRDLICFIKKIKSIKLKVKLDTNGLRPEVIEELLKGGIVDFIAMDIKAPFPLYDKLAGIKVNVQKIEESINLIGNSKVEHEFRTTYVKSLMSEEDIQTIKNIIPNRSTYKIQKFIPKNALDKTLKF